MLPVYLSVQALTALLKTLLVTRTVTILKYYAGATNVSCVSTKSENFLQSMVGRINYEYAGKYLLSAAIRRDGLSVWAPGKNMQTSLLLLWMAYRSGIVHAYGSFISELKVRAGYGITGLNAVAALNNDYPWQVTVAANGATYPFNNVNSTGNASYYNALGNADLNGKRQAMNIGLDLGVMNNRFTLSAEYFTRKTDNLILNVPTPPSFVLQVQVYWPMWHRWRIKD